ncbi:MAG: ankyrin repeat domain-containing protein [Sedimenticola sp.]|nr:ankyrin repeat domain-containing protein [Sedimenticola sp.]
MNVNLIILKVTICAGLLIGHGLVQAQIAPSERTISGYSGLPKAAAQGDLTRIVELLKRGSNIDERDNYRRTPLHIAAYGGHHDVMRELVAAGADPNALENDYYDIVTIAAVANDVETLKLSLELGCRPGNITSRYDGTALIAAAHLGHDEVVRVLINAGAPLDHINNLGWTAVIEAIVLSDGGYRHQATLRALIDAGANHTIPDRNGITPLELATSLGYMRMVKMLESANER